MSSAVMAEGPSYTYSGISYEWTDSKFGIDPSEDAEFNNGSIEGVSLEVSLGILSWFHIAGEYFTGDCVDCGGTGNSASDIDFNGYQIGSGLSTGLGFIGLSNETDFILRGYYIDVELDKIDENGWGFEGQIRSQYSERTEIEIGYAYQDVANVQNRDLNFGLIYRVWRELALTTRATLAGSDTGFDLGVRWYFLD